MSEIEAPVARHERVQFLDVLRGFAVLAIFAVNIKAMFAPFPYYSNASLWPGDYDRLVAAAQAFLIEDKWRTVFTGLFGAGIALIAERARARGAGSLGLLSRRLFFLLIFGLIHLLLIWEGDILTAYALSGFLAIWLRNAGPRTLFWTAAVALLIAVLWNTVFALGPALVPEVREEIKPFLWGDAEFIEENTQTALGGLGPLLASRVESAQQYILMYFIFGGHFLETFAVMLVGMWAYRIRFFNPDAGVPYGKCTVYGLGAAWSLDAARWALLVASDWSFDAYSYGAILNQLDGYAGAIGYAGLVGLAMRARFSLGPVAAAGRMAFTNYIACSLIGTTLALGHGFALFGALTNLELMGVVAATWTAILIWSPLWLSAFRFGPLEWMWRSLTYGRLQPFRRGRPQPA